MIVRFNLCVDWLIDVGLQELIILWVLVNKVFRRKLISWSFALSRNSTNELTISYQIFVHSGTDCEVFYNLAPTMWSYDSKTKSRRPCTPLSIMCWTSWRPSESKLWILFVIKHHLRKNAKTLYWKRRQRVWEIKTGKKIDGWIRSLLNYSTFLFKKKPRTSSLHVVTSLERNFF